MKKNMMLTVNKREDGYRLLQAGRVSASTIREYWQGSPWRAFRESFRTM